MHEYRALFTNELDRNHQQYNVGFEVLLALKIGDDMYTSHL